MLHNGNLTKAVFDGQILSNCHPGQEHRSFVSYITMFLSYCKLCRAQYYETSNTLLKQFLFLVLMRPQ